MSASTKKKLRKEENAAKLTEKQLTEQKEAKKLKGYTLAFAIVVSLVLVAAVVIMGVTAFNNSGILQRNTEALTVGEHTLSNAELNYFYMDAVNEFYSTWNEQYGEYTDMYLSLMGIDTTTPLNKLPYPGSDKDRTYADYFKDQAVTNAANTYAIYDLAVAAGHTVSEDVETTYGSNMSMVEIYASIYNNGDVEGYLKMIYGPGASLESYRNYMDVLALSDSYQASYYNTMTYDEADIAAHNDEHFNEFSSFSYCQYLVDVDDFIVCTDPENKDHTHSSEEVAAAEAAAKAAAESLAAGTYASAEDLDKAINALDVLADAETPKACTPYENILYPNINADVAAWLVADGRTAGDVASITSNFINQDGTDTAILSGYYVVLFQGREDNNMNLVNVRHILAQFKGGTTDSTTGVTTYADVEKKEALDRITEILNQWKADGATEEAFIALATEKSEDTGTKSNGGLCEYVYPGQMVETFNDWCFDTARKVGDYEIVETQYGYHLIYFAETCDTTFRNYMIENTLRNADYETWYTDATAAINVKELNTKYLSLDMVLSNG